MISEKVVLVLFTYKRLSSTLKLIENLKDVNLPIHVFHDYSGSTQNVKLAKELLENKKLTVTIRNENYGLKRNLFEGIDCIAELYEYFIVIEDDLDISVENIETLKSYLLKIDTLKDVFEISGFPIVGRNQSNYPVQIPLGTSWFWGTKSSYWKEFRDEFIKSKGYINTVINKSSFNYQYRYPFTYLLRLDRRGRISSWAIYKHIYMRLNQKNTLYVYCNKFDFIADQRIESTHGKLDVQLDNFSDDWKKNLLMLSQSSRLINLIKSFL